MVCTIYLHSCFLVASTHILLSGRWYIHHLLYGAHFDVSSFANAHDPTLFQSSTILVVRLSMHAQTSLDYHLQALPLRSGAPSRCSDAIDTDYPQEHRNQAFSPPYLIGDRIRPAGYRTRAITTHISSNTTHNLYQLAFCTLFNPDFTCTSPICLFLVSGAARTAYTTHTAPLLYARGVRASYYQTRAQQGTGLDLETVRWRGLRGALLRGGSVFGGVGVPFDEERMGS